MFTLNIIKTTDLSQLTTTLWIAFSVLLLLLILLFMGFLFFNQQSQNKANTILITALKDNNETIISRLSTVIAKHSYTQQPIKKERTTTERKVPIKISTQIIKHLEKFEKKQDFLNPDLKLTKLAESFETNSKYLSKVILKEKGKPYKTYIKDLKVVFAKSRLETERKFRRYKIEVIAEESGFKTAESFSKHFLQTYGVYPSKYIKIIEDKKSRNQC